MRRLERFAALLCCGRRRHRRGGHLVELNLGGHQIFPELLDLRRETLCFKRLFFERRFELFYSLVCSVLGALELRRSFLPGIVEALLRCGLRARDALLRAVAFLIEIRIQNVAVHNTVKGVYGGASQIVRRNSHKMSAVKKLT